MEVRGKKMEKEGRGGDIVYIYSSLLQCCHTCTSSDYIHLHVFGCHIV